MVNRFLDAHCHLDLYERPKDVAQRALAAGVNVLSMTTTPHAFEGNIERLRSFNNVCIGLGMHPELAGTRHHDLNRFKQLLHRSRLVGEIGLDGRPQHRHTWQDQIASFTAILDMLANDDIPRVISLHSPRATKTVIDAIKSRLRGSNSIIILHWFTGSVREAMAAAELGMYFSINYAMLGNDRSIAIVKALPHDRILFETDGPFISIGTKREPADLPEIVDRLAEILGTPRDDLTLEVERASRFVLEAAFGTAQC